MIAALSAVFMATQILDAASTQWKRARRGDRVELNPVMRWLMGVLGDWWALARVFGGLGLWAWVVLWRGWPLIELGDGGVIASLIVLIVLFAHVVWWNSRSRFGLPWYWRRKI